MKTKEQIIKDINTLRKTNKNNWYYLNETYNNRTIQLKGFDTWLQVLKIDNITYPTCMDISVKQFNQQLQEYL